ncbi:MAG: hypothetical protein WDZ37_01180 [Solirubrobacterales bacterium]
MSKSERERAVNTIAIGRIAVGASAWLAPNLSGRLFGLDPERNPQASYIGRLFGARDVVLGAGVLRAPRKQKDTWLKAGLACDVADTAAGMMAGVRGTLPVPAAALVTLTAAGFAAAGYLLQR